MWTRIFPMTLTAAALLLLGLHAAIAANEMYAGRVMTVGEDTIAVLGDMEMTTFAVTAETKITYAGNPAQLRNIQPGDKATVEGNMAGGKLIAKTITAAPAM